MKYRFREVDQLGWPYMPVGELRQDDRLVGYIAHGPLDNDQYAINIQDSKGVVHYNTVDVMSWHYLSEEDMTTMLEAIIDRALGFGNNICVLD